MYVIGFLEVFFYLFYILKLFFVKFMVGNNFEFEFDFDCDDLYIFVFR